MNILTILREVIEAETVEFDPRTDALRKERQVLSLADSDLAAVEMAARLSESRGGSVNLLAWGSEAIEQALREPLARCGGGILRVWDGAQAESDPLAAVELLAAAVRLHPNRPDLILMGVDAGDPLGQVLPPMLAAMLDLPIVTGVVELEASPESNSLVATRRIGRGLREELEVELPALLTVDARVSTPRSATWHEYLHAFQVGIPLKSRKELGCTPRSSSPATELLEVVRPRPFPKRIDVPDGALPPDERIGQVLDADSPQRGGQIVEGEPRELAAQLIAFLKQRKIL